MRSGAGRRRIHDVIVVGAGLAGLNAARELRRSGRTVLVLEARDEVGGRTRTRTIDGEVADFGGEWIGWAHTRARRLIKELGLTEEPARNLRHPVVWRLPSGRSTGRVPPASTWRDLLRVFGRATSLSRGLSRTAPWNAPRARELDRVATAEWLATLRLGPDADEILNRLLGSLATGRLERLSLLHFLWWARHAGGPLRSLHTTFQSRIGEGAQEISWRISRELGDAIQLGAPVVRASDEGGRVAVETPDGEVRAGKRAIVAVPVSLMDRVAFHPPLGDRQRRLSSLHIGAGTKVIALLPSDHRVRANTVVGGDVVWGAWRRGKRITGFAPSIGSEPPEETLIQDLAASFDVPRESLRSPTIFRWSGEEHIPGCDAAFAPGEVCELGPDLPLPCGRLHFAGAERSSWPNNMEGALESGERAAREAEAALADSAP